MCYWVPALQTLDDETGPSQVLPHQEVTDPPRAIT